MIVDMLATSYNVRKQVSSMKCVEVFEDFRPMPSMPNEKLKIFVARTIKGLREDYMDAHDITSDDQFVEHAAAKGYVLDKRSIYNWETERNLPGLDSLNDLVQSCDSSLAEFFQRLIGRSNLAAIERANKQEEEWIDDLVSALSYPRLREMVQKTAEFVRYVLELLEGRSPKQ
jgi:hypothetical protein